MPKSVSATSRYPWAAPCLTILLLATGAQSMMGSVIGHWRFEDGQFLTDSSGNGHTLTAPSAGATPAQFVLGNSGNGSAVPDPLPGTSIQNAFAASFDGGDRLRAADHAAFTDLSFSIEAYVSIATMTTAQMSIAGQWNSTGNQRSYLLAANGGNGGLLNFLYSTGGGDTITLVSPFALVANTDYYVAVTVDLADTSTNGITFYFQNLTSGGTLQSFGVAHTATTLFDASTAFTIGSTDQPSSPFNGLIDEVRLSDTKLAASELQIVPEPSSLALVGLGSLLALRRRQARAR